MTKRLALKDCEKVKLSAVDVEDNTYRITTKATIDDIVRSIQQVGLIHPPILKPKLSGYAIVSGFRRIAASNHLKWIEIPARILNPHIEDATCIQLAIADNALQRPLNPVEISRALVLLSSATEAPCDRMQTAAELGLPENPVLIRKLKIICGLPEAIQDGILQNTISLSMALELAKYEPDPALALVRLFNHLRIGLNNQRELILLINEIALRERISIQAMLAGTEVRTILDNRDLDCSQKHKQLKAYLKQRRYPAITRAKIEFEKFIQGLQLDHRVTLNPPKDFEGSTYTLNVRFTDLSELKELHGQINSALRSTAMQTFFAHKSR